MAELDNFDDFDEEEGNPIDELRKSIARRIVEESERLVDELFNIAYDADVQAKTRLSAITILLDRGVPKLGVQHTKDEETDEPKSRSDIREEIENLLLGQDDDDEDEIEYYIDDEDEEDDGE